MKLVDVAVNLTDAMFQGVYHGKTHHAPDIQQVLKRAVNSQVIGLLLTGTDYPTSRQNLEFCDGNVFTTAGVHPTNADDFDKDSLLIDRLEEFITQNRQKVVSIGECGLDYDRLQFCSKDVQIKGFGLQLDRLSHFKLPFFLHNRNTGSDFYEIVSQYPGLTGVVHSFTGPVDEMMKLCKLGLYIGVNGCSLKTEENCKVVRQIPLDRLLLETDSPWCDIRPTHHSYKLMTPVAYDTVKKEKHSADKLVKGRNEPCRLTEVLSVVAQLHDISQEQLAEHVYKNTINLFPQFRLE